MSSTRGAGSSSSGHLSPGHHVSETLRVLRAPSDPNSGFHTAGTAVLPLRAQTYKVKSADGILAPATIRRAGELRSVAGAEIYNATS